MRRVFRELFRHSYYPLHETAGHAYYNIHCINALGYITKFRLMINKLKPLHNCVNIFINILFFIAFFNIIFVHILSLNQGVTLF